jgi:transcriptional regulator NrdR family protein|tara:strand:+ start:67 stop:360 length:294 start_codon:yes stop_codon:yes gene_type:complete
MNCIKCKGTTSVVDSRPQETSAIKRRRKCGTCGHRFNTIEQVLTEAAIVKEVVKEVVRIKKPKIKPRNPFNDDAYLDSLSDDELEALIGGEEFETYR